MVAYVHHPAYDAETVADDHRFPMRKYTALARQLMLDGIVSPGGYLVPEPASADTLATAHDRAYVDAVLSSNVDRQRSRKIGFEMTPAIALRTSASVGGTILAAECALKDGAALNTAGGSHHADFEGGAGFCVFNDVAVAARVMLNRGRARRIAVIDCDVHQGDGTARIFVGDDRVYTFSLHCEENWPVRKAVSDRDTGLAQGTGDDAYLSTLEHELQAVLDKTRPDLVFYNAGVDPHADDRLGKLKLSDEGLWEREKLVLTALNRAGIPVACVLGGGYDRDVDALARRHALIAHALEYTFSAKNFSVSASK